MDKALNVKALFTFHPARHVQGPPVKAFLAWLRREAGKGWFDRTASTRAFIAELATCGFTKGRACHRVPPLIGAGTTCGAASGPRGAGNP